MRAYNLYCTILQGDKWRKLRNNRASGDLINGLHQNAGMRSRPETATDVPPDSELAAAGGSVGIYGTGSQFNS